jgi:LacI family transcriptional regulator
LKKRVTIKDIADKAGVSLGTIDRVIHNRGNVAIEVATKVREVMEEMGFERNLLASALAYNKTYNIAIVLPAFESDVYWQKPRQGIVDAHKKVGHYGINIEFFDFELFNLKDFKQKLLEAYSHRPDAMVFPPLFYNESISFLDDIKESRTKIITLNTFIAHAAVTAFIGQNSYRSGVLAARLLNFNRHDKKEFVLLNLDKYSTDANHLIDKEKGFKDFFQNLNQANISVIKYDFEDFDDACKLHLFIEKLLHRHTKIAGVFVTNSRAYLVADLIKRHDCHINILGFDLIDKNIDLLKEGKINFLINQNSHLQGYNSLMSFYDHFYLQKPMQLLDYLPLDIIVPENVEYYL